MKTLVDLVERRRSTDSDLSSISDDGYKLKIFTHSLANNICSSFLKMMGLLSKQYPSWDYMHVELFTITLLRSMTVKASPDGFIALKHSKKGIVPHIWVEAKTLDYAPSRNPKNIKTPYLKRLLKH